MENYNYETENMERKNLVGRDDSPFGLVDVDCAGHGAKG